MLGRYEKSEQTALKGLLKNSISNLNKNPFFYQGPKSSLQIRILFHIAHQQNDEEKFSKFHHQLQNTVEDQMCLASMHYMKNNYQEALDIYKNYLANNRYIYIYLFISF